MGVTAWEKGREVVFYLLVVDLFSLSSFGTPLVFSFALRVVLDRWGHRSWLVLPRHSPAGRGACRFCSFFVFVLCFEVYRT